MRNSELPKGSKSNSAPSIAVPSWRGFLAVAFETAETKRAMPFPKRKVLFPLLPWTFQALSHGTQNWGRGGTRENPGS